MTTPKLKRVFQDALILIIISLACYVFLLGVSLIEFPLTKANVIALSLLPLSVLWWYQRLKRFDLLPLSLPLILWITFIIFLIPSWHHPELNGWYLSAGLTALLLILEALRLLLPEKP